MPEFTRDWFSRNIEQWQQWLAPLGRAARCLEIGVFEGRASMWIVENLCGDGGQLCCVDPHVRERPRQLFLRNVQAQVDKGTLQYYRELSGDFLRRLDRQVRFDFVYVDGDHSYFEWAVQEVLLPDLRAPGGHQITLASGYNRPQSFPDHPDLCRTRPIWTSWGWAVEPKRLGWILSQWCTRNARCFTCRFQSYRPWRREIYPQLSRIQNIGYEKGENRRSPQWYRANHRTPWVAGETSGHFRYSP